MTYPPAETFRLALLRLSPNLSSWGFVLSAQDERSLTFTRRYRSGWVIAACILLFPIGLLALLIERRTQTISVVLTPAGEGTRVIFSGEVDSRLEKTISGTAPEWIEAKP